MLNKVKRPILVIAIGYIIGIIEGLYLKSIVPIYIFITILYLINKIINLEIVSEHMWYLKGKKVRIS